MILPYFPIFTVGMVGKVGSELRPCSQELYSKENTRYMKYNLVGLNDVYRIYETKYQYYELQQSLTKVPGVRDIVWQNAKITAGNIESEHFDRGIAPKDTLICGYLNEECVNPPINVIFVWIGIVVALFLILTVYLIVHTVKVRQKLQDQSWRVNWEDVMLSYTSNDENLELEDVSLAAMDHTTLLKVHSMLQRYGK